MSEIGKPTSQPSTPNIWIAGPHPLFNLAIEALITQLPGISVRGYFDHFEQLLDRQTWDHSDLVLLIMPQTYILEHLSSIHGQHSHPRVLLLSTAWETEQALVALKSGATGCISGNMSLEEFAGALRQAARGEITLPPDLAQAVFFQLAQRETPSSQLSSESLTSREQEVLTLICKGLSNKQIAQRLYLSVRTVENHLISIYTKLGVHSRTEAAVLALQQGFVS